MSETNTPIGEQEPSASMVERVSRALFPNEWLALDRGLVRDHASVRAELLARTAKGIAAMREPTTAMIAALEAYNDEGDYPYWWRNSVVREPEWLSGVGDGAYRAMIDAALAEGTER